MSILSSYRGMPDYVAVPLAVAVSAGLATGFALLGAFTLWQILQREDPSPGPVGGVLLTVSIPIIAVPIFVAVVSVLINLHHPISWVTPTLAFVCCTVLAWLCVPFDNLEFASIILGTGAIAWFVTCLQLRRKRKMRSSNVLQA